MSDFWDNATPHLQAPLDTAAIKPPPKGKFGEYVDALHIIREANRIFGHGGWSYEVTRLELTHRAIVDKTYNGQTTQQLRLSYLCSVKVSVGGSVSMGGAIREGTAVGIGAGKPDNEGDVHESAVKEAETDALKRALRTFGNTFGLALYEKDKSAREVEDKSEVDRRAAMIEKLVANAVRAIEAEERMDGLVEFWKDLAKNSPAVARDKRVIAAKDKRKYEIEKEAE